MKYRNALVLAGLASSALTAVALAQGLAPTRVELKPTGKLADGSASTARAVATVIPQGGARNLVVISFWGLKPNAAHAGHIHTGSCAAPGGVVIPLSDVKADANGYGVSVTLVDELKMPTRGYFNFHQGTPPNVGGGITCGDINASMMTAPAAANLSKSLNLAASGPLATGQASAAAGNAVLVPVEGGKTLVTVYFRGLPAGGKHAGHIHTGACATPGGVAVPLAEVMADDKGRGVSFTVVDTARIPATSYVNYHQGVAPNVGGGITCGDIK
ncbi:MAG TPA: hypothetical protein VNT60_04550 [Deinococcales bacterium]|nr:hypothetical protein [Deinococcales bacterium]